MLRNCLKTGMARTTQSLADAASDKGLLALARGCVSVTLVPASAGIKRHRESAELVIDRLVDGPRGHPAIGRDEHDPRRIVPPALLAQRGMPRV